MKLSEAIKQLKAAGIDEATQEAHILFCEIGGISRHKLLGADPDLALPKLEIAIRKRIEREPLAYILGKTPFFKELYTVTHDVLIPRTDTELVVERAIELLPKNGHFVDLCTGSGCIAISILANRPDATALAVDISPAAIAIAQKNAEQNGVSARISFLQCNLLTAEIPGIFDLIVSNPPYIDTKTIDALEPELHFEPRIALDGGSDGMDFYRRILSIAPAALRPNGTLLLEIGYDQEKSIRSLSSSLDLSATVSRDLGGNPRMAEIHLP